MLTLERAKELNGTRVTEEHLILHAKNVSYAMGAMARHFGQDPEHWEAVGMLHDYDYEQYPEEHLQHTEEPLLAAGVPAEDVRAIMSHGWGICTDVKPETEMEKSLFTVDELTGIIQACARMRPNGIRDLEIKSFMKKYKDKKFAAKCDRELIRQGCELLGMDVKDVAEICIEGMRPHAEELGLAGTGTAEIRRILEDKRAWIDKALARVREREQQPKLTGDEVKALAREAKKVIPPRVSAWARFAGISYGRIAIRKQRTRWGSCSAEGNLNFNCLLMLCPEPVMDYVIVHELCHRKELNHSPRFWAEVEKILPEYRQAKQWLKTEGQALIGRLG